MTDPLNTSPDRHTSCVQAGAWAGWAPRCGTRPDLAAIGASARPNRAGARDWLAARLSQVLWCPCDHSEFAHPRTVLRWRSSASVTEVLATPPEPPVVQFDWYLPLPCLLTPEQVTEYPSPMELSEELQAQLGDTALWEAAGYTWDSTGAATPQEFYFRNLSHAPGWKTGGWTRWGLTDPSPRPGPECGTETIPLVTIASREWNAGSKSWMPEEERTNPTLLPMDTQPSNVTLLTIADAYDLQLHVCPVSSDHPHIELVQ